MKPSKQFMQIGFKKKTKVSKDSHLQSARRPVSKQNMAIFLNTTEADYLLETQTNQKQKVDKSNIKPKPPMRRRLMSFQQSNILRKNSKSFIHNISHRSRSKSKLDQKLDEMLINQRVKEELASQKRSRCNFISTTQAALPNEKTKLNKSIGQATLSKYINQVTQDNKSQKKTKNEQYISTQLGSIINLIDSLFGVSRSQKLVNSFRQQQCMSIPNLIATIKIKLEAVGKDSNFKSNILTKNSN